ncbi:MAG: AbrB/MazE/SpoVT family DNA-binding domain-containing protein [Thermomicrobiales bacterium]
MKEMLATLTSKGQLTVPAEVRRQLGLKQGDKVAFILKDGQVTLHVPRYVGNATLRGAAGTLSQPLSWKEIEQVVAEERAERAALKAPR